MESALLAIFSMYIFIVLGFSAKRAFGQQIDAKTLNLLSVYFLQPFLTFWGLMQRPIDTALIQAPLYYLLVVILVILAVIPLVRFFFSDIQERSIATVAALIGNTGNLGIPLGIAIFGLESVPYMTLINLMNVFVVYTVGVYFYSRGNFSVKASLLNIIKLPILWFAVLALFYNYFQLPINEQLLKMLTMGAFASIVIQLLLFGIYLEESKLQRIGSRLLFWVMGMKFLLLPAVTFAVLWFVPLDATVKGMIFMELFMPLAVANINISSLYGCRPVTVTVLVFISSVLFLGLMFIYTPIINRLYLP